MLLIATVLLALTAAAPAGAGSGGAKLQLRKTKVGTILVNSRGFTVYAFTKDTRNRDNCGSACLRFWPPVATAGRPIAGPGVRSSLIGTIRLKNGVEQVTYAGHPLYTYSQDTRPAETKYINLLQFGGFWPAMNAAGQEVK